MNILTDKRGGPSWLLEFVIAPALIVLLVCASARADDTVLGPETQVVVKQAGPQTEAQSELDALCGGPNARVQYNGTGASFPSLPCETVRTDIALERLDARPGFMATSTRMFLRARLFMHGMGSVIFGFVGLG